MIWIIFRCDLRTWFCFSAGRINDFMNTQCNQSKEICCRLRQSNQIRAIFCGDGEGGLISIWFNSVVLLSLPVVGNHLDCYRCCSAFMNLEYYERGLCTYYMRYGIELYYAILIVIVIILTSDRVSKI